MKGLPFLYLALLNALVAAAFVARNGTVSGRQQKAIQALKIATAMSVAVNENRILGFSELESRLGVDMEMGILPLAAAEALVALWDGQVNHMSLFWITNCKTTYP